MKKIDWMIIGLIAFILIGIILIYNEVSSAKEFCDSVNGSYKLDWGNYSCNGKSIAKYDDGWDYERDPSKVEINISEIYH